MKPFTSVDTIRGHYTHQGRGNVVLIPLPSERVEHGGSIRCRERLGGLLKYYDYEAA
jgi:putative transposase